MPRGRKKKEVAAAEEAVEETKPAEEVAEEAAPEEEEVSAEEVSEEETETEEEVAEEEVEEESTEEEVEAEEEVVEEASTEEEPKPEAHTKVKYEHAFVIQVLNDGRHFEDKVHCKMTDGTTKHVPRNLFSQFAVSIPEFAQLKDQEDSE